MVRGVLFTRAARSRLVGPMTERRSVQPLTRRPISRRRLLGGAALLSLGVDPRGSGAVAPSGSHTATAWTLQANEAYDALCFLNVLSDDPFYLQYYRVENDSFAPKVTPVVRGALDQITREVKGRGGIVSAFLCLHLSAASPSTVEELSRTLEHPDAVRKALKSTPYHSDAGWRQLLAVRPALQTVLGFLTQCGFVDNWRSAVLPGIEAAVQRLRPALASQNVVGEVERALGKPLPSNAITVYLLHYNQPHGMRLTGARFIPNAAWPLRVMIQNAAHELMHPPYDLKGDAGIGEVLAALRRDAFLMERVDRHNPSFGYNTLESFDEEDCVRALDQVVTEKLGIGWEPRQRWREEDDGMHVLSVALYSLVKEERYPTGGETFRDFLVRMVRSRRLASGRVRALYEAFYLPTAVPSGSITTW
jgi:hypothetical protein